MTISLDVRTCRTCGRKPALTDYSDKTVSVDCYECRKRFKYDCAEDAIEQWNIKNQSKPKERIEPLPRDILFLETADLVRKINEIIVALNDRQRT